MRRQNRPWLPFVILLLAGCTAQAPSAPELAAGEIPATGPAGATLWHWVGQTASPQSAAELALAPAQGGATGAATYYGIRHHGRRTASGEVFNRHALTAAHPRLPLGSSVRVTSLATGASVVVRINDRCRCPGSMIDLSEGAARAIGLYSTGRVRLERL